MTVIKARLSTGGDLKDWELASADQFNTLVSNVTGTPSFPGNTDFFDHAYAPLAGFPGLRGLTGGAFLNSTDPTGEFF